MSDWQLWLPTGRYFDQGTFEACLLSVVIHEYHVLHIPDCPTVIMISNPISLLSPYSTGLVCLNTLSHIHIISCSQTSFCIEYTRERRHWFEEFLSQAHHLLGVLHSDSTSCTLRKKQLTSLWHLIRSSAWWISQFMTEVSFQSEEIGE